MSFPAYPAYQPTDSQLLGPVPAHWALCPVKRFARLTYGDALPTEARDEAGVVAVFGSNGPVGAHDRPNTSAPVIVVGRKGSYGALNWSEGPVFVIDTAYFIDAASADCDLRWLLWALRAANLSAVSQDTGVPGLAREAVHDLPFVLPSRPEQLAIAAFLDRECDKIDGLVAEQERLIALLKEKRQAVISQAVTKGLDPNAPMKNSGIEWLGQVPTHWEVRRIKDVARLESGHTPSKQFPEYWDGGDIEWVSLNDSKHLAANDFISETAFKITAAGLANSSARLLPSGAVVFTRDATIGLAAITTREMAVSQHLIAWCPSPAITSLFLLRVFNAMKAFLDGYTAGATIKTIGMPEVRKLVTPVPPIEEQEAIVTFITTETARLDTLTTEAERAIALLKERRAALISAAVTGQIDVRGLAAAKAAEAA